MTALTLGVTAILVGCWAVVRSAGPGGWRDVAADTAPGTGWLLAVCALGAVQILPGIGEGSASLLAVHTDTSSTLSVVPARTAARIPELLACIAIGWLAGLVFQQTRRAHRFALVLLLATGLLAVVGLLFRAGITTSPYDQHPTDVVVGTFCNRNNFAGCLELGLLFGCGPIFLLIRQRSRWRLAPVCVVWLLGFAALLGTESRAGLLAFAAGALVFGLLLRHASGRALPWRGLSIAAVLGLVVLLTLIPDSLRTRFGAVGGELTTAGMRPDIWSAGLRAALEFPILGSGLGTYGDVSPFFQGPAVPGHVLNAHCDPLELLVEGGILGLCCVGLATILFARFCWRRLPACTTGHRRTQLSDRAILAAGGLAALTALAAHGFVDFNFQIPSNAAWTAGIAGCVFGLLRERSVALVASNSARAISVRIASGALAAAVAWLAIDSLSAARSSAIIAPTADKMGSVAIAELRAAERLHSLTGEPARALGAALLAADTDRASLHDLDAIAHRALRRNPLSPAAHRLHANALLAAEPSLDPTQPEVRAAFERSLRCTAPFDRLGDRRSIGLALLAAGATDAGIAWQRDLVRRCIDSRHTAATTALQERADRLLDTVLTETVAAVPEYSWVAKLGAIDAVTADRRDLHDRLAQALLEQGDFAAREVELRQANGASFAAAQEAAKREGGITLSKGYRLLAQRIRSIAGASGPAIEIGLRFAIPPIEDRTHRPPPACALRIVHPDAVLVRSLEPTAAPFSFQLALEPTLPAGEYEAQLVFASRGPPIGLGSFHVNGRTISADVDRVYPARSILQWGSRSPTRHQPIPGALQLSGEDRAWCELRWPTVGGQPAVLVLAIQPLATTGPGSSPAPLRVSWGDGAGGSTTELEEIAITSTLIRLAAPGTSTLGTLEIRSTSPQPVVLRSLFFEPPPTAAPPPTGR